MELAKVCNGNDQQWNGIFSVHRTHLHRNSIHCVIFVACPSQKARHFDRSSVVQSRNQKRKKVPFQRVETKRIQYINVRMRSFAFVQICIDCFDCDMSTKSWHFGNGQNRIRVLRVRQASSSDRYIKKGSWWGRTYFRMSCSTSNRRQFFFSCYPCSSEAITKWLFPNKALRLAQFYFRWDYQLSSWSWFPRLLPCQLELFAQRVADWYRRPFPCGKTGTCGIFDFGNPALDQPNRGVCKKLGSTPPACSVDFCSMNGAKAICSVKDRLTKVAICGSWATDGFPGPDCGFPCLAFCEPDGPFGSDGIQYCCYLKSASCLFNIKIYGPVLKWGSFSRIESFFKRKGSAWSQLMEKALLFNNPLQP